MIPGEPPATTIPARKIPTTCQARPPHHALAQTSYLGCLYRLDLVIMICAVCYNVLRGHQGAQWRGTWDLHFDHHIDRQELEDSADMSCCICRSILREITHLEEKEKEKEKEQKRQRLALEVNSVASEPFNGQTALTNQETELSSLEAIEPDTEQQVAPQRPLFIIFFLLQVLRRLWETSHADEIRPVVEQIVNDDNTKIVDTLEHPRNHSILRTPKSLVTAYLSQLNDKNYRLDFKWKDTENVGTFILQKTDGIDARLFHTPFSHTTKSDEVLQQAKKWIETCRRKGDSGHSECPGEDEERSFYPTRLIDLGVKDPDTGQWPDGVRLVEISEKPFPKDYYVTLSHCWGTADFLRLTPENENELLGNDITLKKLPKTFRHAIKFARRLGSVPTFRDRLDLDDPLPIVRYIWIDSLCIMQGPSSEARKDWLRESAKMYKIYNKAYCNLSATASVSTDEGLFRKREPHTLWEDEINLNVEGIPIDPRQGNQINIQRCVIQDLSFWARIIDDAPVNRRGWVLQERMMAPRVIHFCENQIAWECSHLEAAESAQDGVPSLHIQPGISPATDSIPPIRQGVQRRGSYAVQAAKEGADREQRYIDAVEHWQTVIERYSKTKLTNAGDKIIALSGYARMKSEELPPTCDYLAGMWSHHLESQLLWRVHPVFKNGKFEYPSKRPENYRAPTWSWAAVSAPQGITFDEITNNELYIKVEKANTQKDPPDNKFGLVTGGELVLHGIVKRITLDKQDINGAVRYEWNLRSTDIIGNLKKHSIVYLDSPESDTDILGSEGRMYLMPAREDADGYLVCLLLQLKHIKQDKVTMRRVGLTKVSPYEGDDDIEVVEVVREPCGDEANILGEVWKESTKQHRICIV